MAEELEHRDGQAMIVTPVTDALAKISDNVSAGFARVETKLEGKADKTDLAEIHTTLRDHGSRIGVLETDKAVAEQAKAIVHGRRKAFWGVVYGVSIVVVGGLGVLVTLLVAR